MNKLFPLLIQKLSIYFKKLLSFMEGYMKRPPRSDVRLRYTDVIYDANIFCYEYVKTSMILIFNTLKTMKNRSTPAGRP